MNMIRKFVLSLVLIDNWLSNVVRRPFGSKWILKGQCNKCGKCCESIKLKIDPRLLSSKFTSTLVIAWVSWLFNFYLKDIEYERNYLVFGCKKVRKNGECGDYKWRPNVCRNYPLVDFFEEPVFLETCGYKARKTTNKSLIK